MVDDWFERVNGKLKTQRVGNEQAKEVLEKLHESNSDDSCIIVVRDEYYLVFFEREAAGKNCLMSATITPDWESFHIYPEESDADYVEHVYEGGDWSDIYFAEEGPDIITDYLGQ